MADTETVKKSVLLTGIDELSPKLNALVARVDSFKNNLEKAGLGKLDISGLFKGGSVITPFVDGIKASDAFKGKLVEVGEATKAVDLPGAPESAAQSMNIFSASMAKVSTSIDAALAPAVATLVVGLEPLLTGIGSLLNDNPKLVESLAIGAMAFSAMQTAVTGATQVFDLMNAVVKTNPIMLIAMGVALAAGLIIANWTPISAFFTGLWDGVKNVATQAVAVLSTVFSWTPLGMVIANWAPITGFFSGIWDGIKAVTSTLVGYLETAFSWTPLGMIIDNWAGLTGLFSAIWELLKALTVPVIDFLKGLFDWTPLGMIINNWGGITGFFSSIWTALQPAAQAIKDFFGTLFDYSPLGMIVNNWGAISAFFDPLWAALQASAQVVKDFFTSVFEWSPMAQIAANWQPISEVFSALWGVVQALAAPALEFLHGMFEWSPLGQIIKNWEPITEWFSGLWKKLQEVIAPIRELFDGGFAGVIAKVTGKVEGLAEAQKQTNAEGKGELAPAFFGAGTEPASTTELAPGNLAQKPSMLTGSLTQNSSALIQQTAANNRTQLEGGLTVRFENAPAGLRTDQPQTNQPALALNSRIGYRSLSLGGSNELA
ncbi:phage tail protein [Pseudomonas frederiksbergensis]|uniref:Phage tail protein n=1 Tax=Pseudomonas frederiksbergensis TaxID=104087 RepID=A0A423KM56_9PSED|nr:phage tail protein [Pseudomonas frederiksbergensis]RON54964.1 phage tail protein [Pseudomonas frederiksbergensis]